MATGDSRRDPVGLIGVGLMGTAMAGRFLAGGLAVVGFDIDPERTAGLLTMGGSPEDGPAEVIRSCPRVVLSLPDSEKVAALLDGLGDAFRPGQVVIDTTTGGPYGAEESSRRLGALGVDYLDAAISGSSAQVDQATATVMAGGDFHAFQRCGDLFGLIARASHWIGPAGSGSRMKLASNLVLGLNRAALAEALNFAEAVGLDLPGVLAVLRDSPAYSRVMDAKGEKMLNRDFAPQARLAQHHKDVRLMLEEARKAEALLPLTEAHDRLLSLAEELGLGALDNSAIFEVYRRRERQ